MYMLELQHQETFHASLALEILLLLMNKPVGG